ncbi:MAG: dTDP-4-dehydrorhamnose 3,5-epimerase [Coprobacillus cateniformis]|uniref:dTDP-4-dehydrorhamnose 3,5-epimerase n=1 Tax=Longibaculum muris TaxID=1796628 RepID=UPI003AB23E66|nr:dTDP-4-dehydrorhamnose 3,5-epimerase [Coprobacillus cateniformis]
MIQKFEFSELDLKGAYLIKPFISWDNRGCFIKDYSKEIFEQQGINYDLQEVFYTVSHKGVIRALHFQEKKQQAKLVRCIKGKIYDVIVDLRKDSPTYKQWKGFYLSDENNNELLVPKHFAHGYLVLEDSIVSYKCAEKFYGEYDSGIIWDDPKLNIEWPIDEIGGLEKIINSEKDKNLQSFEEWENRLQL